MNLWPFTRKRSEGAGTAPAWESLSENERTRVARKIAGAALDLGSRAHFGKGFEAVSFPFRDQRRRPFVETKGEDKVLTQYERHEIVNMHRDMMRNSPTRVAQDQQLRVNVVGSCGGKLYASFPEGYGAAADAVMRYFNKVWFPHAEFTFRKNFNWLLKTCLTASDTNGNVALVFDDGFLTGGDGTGRIRGFEGDEIAPVTESEFAKHFPKGFKQSAGLVYDPSGILAGAFVSTKCRGRGMFTAGEYITLKREALSDEDANWVLLGDMRRFNQGRAISPLTAAINCLIDLHETTASEAQAAKLNAKMVGQILTDASADPDDGSGAAFDDETPDSQAVSEEVNFSTRELSAIGAHFDQMPPGLKIDLLKTERPNPNMPAYIEFLTGLVGGTRGMARVYATLKAQTSYTAFRGEQSITKPSFEEAQQDLERDVCDWAARQVIARAVKLGLINEALPDDWQSMLAWRWPSMPEIDESKAQDALSKKLSNGVTSLARELGPGEVDKIIEERRIEKAKFTAAGLAYPGEAEPQFEAPIMGEEENYNDNGGEDAE